MSDEHPPRLFAGGIARALLANRRIDAVLIQSELTARWDDCLSVLEATGFDTARFVRTGHVTNTLAIADAAQHFVDALGENGDLEVETAADVLGSLAILFDAQESQSVVRVKAASILVGLYEQQHGATRSKLFEMAGNHGYRREMASRHGREATAEKRKKAAVWQQKAREAFGRRINQRQSADSWARNHYKSYASTDGTPVRWETLAKAVRKS